MMLGFDLQYRFGRKVFQENPAFDLRLHNMAIYLIAEVGVRREKGGLAHGKVAYWAQYKPESQVRHQKWCEHPSERAV